MDEMKTIQIKGKEYVMIHERIKAFRQMFKDYTMTSEIIQLDEKSCVIKANIKNARGELVANGLAREERNASSINSSSYVENAETSAWGRALANLGVGIDTSICSAEELAFSISSQEQNKGTLVTRNSAPKTEEKKEVKQEQAPTPKTENKAEILCEICKQPISSKVAEFSKSKMGRCLCMACQKKPNQEQTKIEPKPNQEQPTLIPVEDNGELPF